MAERNAEEEPIPHWLVAGAWLAASNFIVGIPIGSFNVRPLHVWTPVAILAIAPRLSQMPWARIELPVSAAIGGSFFLSLATLLGTPTEFQARGLADVFLFASNMATFIVLLASLVIVPSWWCAFCLHLFGAAIAVAILASLRAFMLIRGGSPLQADSFALGLGTVAGSYFAAFCAAAGIVAVGATTWRARTVALLGFALELLAMILALARGPWLGCLFGLGTGSGLLLLSIPEGKRRLQAFGRLAVALVLGVGALLLLALASPGVWALASGRLLQFGGIGSGTGYARLQLFDEVFHDALRSPLLGAGAASYRQISQRLGVQDTVSENFFLEIFHAGGALTVGLVGVVSLAGVWRLARVSRTTGDDAIPWRPAVCAGLVTAIASSLTNPAGWNGLLWVLSAVAASATSEGDR